MNRIVCILLIILFICMCGCTRHDVEMIQPVNFYYCNDPITFNGINDVIAPEVRESANYDDIIRLINLYLDGPITDGYSSPFPPSVTVRSLKENNKTLNITLSSEFANLTGIELTLACTCLSATLFELTDAKSIAISADGVLLDESETVIVIRDTMVFSDSYNQLTEPTSNMEE